MFHEILVVVHVLICAGLIGLILIQHGKGADAGAAFGSGASATVFGSQGSGSFLSRTTAILATTFFVTSLTLAYFSGQRLEPESVMDKVQEPSTTIESEVPTVPDSSRTEEEVPSTSPTSPEAVEGEEVPAVSEEIPTVPTEQAKPVVPQPPVDN